MQNNIYQELVKLGVCDESTVKPFHQTVRDRSDISVLQDQRSGVIFLDKISHMNSLHYEQIDGCQYWNTENRNELIEAINMYLKDGSVKEKERQSLVSQQCWKLDGNSAIRIVNYIICTK